ncbi:MAG: serine/threonine protein kinase [Alphaproteobacteria bacterium]|nr:serine/threonine protein kinase [Alphaproteobacteria bacterium]
MRPPMDPRTGDPEAPLRVGEWLLGAPLHGGGSAALNLCRRAGESVDRYVLKRPPADAAWPLAARLAQEGALLRRLSHRHIVALVDAGTAEDGRPYLVLPRLEGETLACSALATPALLQLGVQLAEALAHAHARGIAHRDLKPENVLVSAGGQATLIDLGVGWAADAGEGLSGEGQGPGTPRYMPPERLVGRPEDPRPGDVYALGVVLWERLSARLAFAELAPADLLAAKRAGPLPALSGQPEALVALLQRMSAPEAEARPSAAAVSQALSALLPAVTEGPGSTPWMQTAAGPEQAAPAAPRQLDRFTLLQELGRGGMGVVYRAWDPLRRQEVALKTASSSSQRGLRLQREVRALSRLTHPAIVRTLDAGEVGGAPYYTMELVEGPTLRALIAGGPQPPRRATAWVLALAEGLQHAHEQGVIHRDVKPENVLMAEGKEPRLSDFGLARQLDPESHALTRTGELLGTPLYMAPEQIEGGPVDARADVYALGAVLYELLCGSRPTRRTTPPACCTASSPARRRRRARARRACPRSSTPSASAPWPGTRGSATPTWRRSRRTCRRSMAGEALDPVTRPRRWGRAGWLAALAGLLLLSLSRACWALGGWSRGQRERAAAAHLADVEAQITQLLAAGEFAQADQAFEAYAASDAAQQTLALSEGWLHQAARLATRGEAAELTALARAYESAVGPEQIVDALLATADALRRRGRWLDLAAVATLLAERAPEAVQASPEALALLAEGRVIRRDFSQPEGRGRASARGHPARPPHGARGDQREGGGGGGAPGAAHPGARRHAHPALHGGPVLPGPRPAHGLRRRVDAAAARPPAPDDQPGRGLDPPARAGGARGRAAVGRPRRLLGVPLAGGGPVHHRPARRPPRGPGPQHGRAPAPAPAHQRGPLRHHLRGHGGPGRGRRRGAGRHREPVAGLRRAPAEPRSGRAPCLRPAGPGEAGAGPQRGGAPGSAGRHGGAQQGERLGQPRALPRGDPLWRPSRPVRAPLGRRGDARGAHPAQRAAVRGGVGRGHRRGRAGRPGGPLRERRGAAPAAARG